MSTPHEWAPVARLAGPELLERAVGYARGSLMLVGSTDLDARTPCAGWDLLGLLRHMNDALAAFTEAAEIGYVDLVPVRGTDPGAELVDRLKNRACALLAAWSHHPGTGSVTVHDRELRSDLFAAAGSVEIVVHGWDVAQACGVDRPIPAALALELLDVVPLFVHDTDRPARFADAVAVPLHARPSDRLVAALGRPSS
ncbi:maleylpyruvate isomerase family mycothiol-dependent enzyme [soil metagenome]